MSGTALEEEAEEEEEEDEVVSASLAAYLRKDSSRTRLMGVPAWTTMSAQRTECGRIFNADQRELGFLVAWCADSPWIALRSSFITVVAPDPERRRSNVPVFGITT